MKLLFKITLLSLLLLFSLSTFSQSVKKEYYDYAKTKLMAQYQVNTSGEKHGWFKGYDQQGILVMEYNFKNNLLDGLCKEYTSLYGSREISKSETYKAGILHGPAKYYGQKGLVLKEGNYVDGEKQGKWLFLDPYTNWSLSEEQKKGADYVKSFPVFEKGEFTFPDGEVTTYYYPSGKLNSIQNYKGGKKVGKQIYYLPDGTIHREEFFDDLQALKEQFVDSALTAFKNLDFEKAADYFKKMKNDGDYTTMKKLADVKTLEAQEKYKEAIQLISKVMNNVSNPVITDYYNSIYLKYIAQLDLILEKYSLALDAIGLEKTISEQGGIFKDQDSKRYATLLQLTKDNSKKRAQEIKDLDNKITSIIQDYTSKNVIQKQTILLDDKGQAIMKNTYPRGEYFYTKSKIIIDTYFSLYNAESTLEKKKVYADEIIRITEKLNALTDKECKSLNKELKTIESQEDIKKVLGL